MNNKKYNENEFIEDLINPISDIMQETQFNVLAVMTERIKKIGKMSASDAQRLSQLVKMEDLDTIESIISAGTKLSVKQVDSIINDMASKNDNLAENLYKARGMDKSSFLKDSSLASIIDQARKSIKDNIVNLSDTRSVGLVINGEFKSTKQAYNYAVNRAVFEVQQGLFDYNTSVRNLLVEMAKNGVQTKVEYQSGYRRRLDSAIKMNVADGCRQMNVAYREKQGQQFGADGIELSAHGLSEQIHARYQGKQFSKKEFEKIQSSLERPFFTMNCKHYGFPIILGISKQVHSDKELKEYDKKSKEEVTYTTLQRDSGGKYVKKSLSRYDASQTQRQIETSIRQLKDVRNQLELNNDTIGVSEYNKKIKEKTKYYKYVSKEIGLEPNLTNLRVYKPK